MLLINLTYKNNTTYFYINLFILESGKKSELKRESEREIGENKYFSSACIIQI